MKFFIVYSSITAAFALLIFAIQPSTNMSSNSASVITYGDADTKNEPVVRASVSNPDHKYIAKFKKYPGWWPSEKAKNFFVADGGKELGIRVFGMYDLKGEPRSISEANVCRFMYNVRSNVLIVEDRVDAKYNKIPFNRYLKEFGYTRGPLIFDPYKQ